MTKQEFESRVGYKVTDSDYDYIESMYYDCGNMDKDQFCKDYKDHKDSKLVHEYFRLVSHRKSLLDNYRSEKTETAYFLIKKSMVGGDKDMIEVAISLIGEQRYIEHKLDKGYNLFPEDKEIIKRLIRNK